MVTLRGQHAGDKGQQLFGAPVEAGFQEPSAARGASAFNSQEIPGTVVFIVISDHLPALLLTVPGPLLGLLPSSCSWWPFWLGSSSKENHRGTLCSTVGGLVGRFLRGKGLVSTLAGSRALGTRSCWAVTALSPLLTETGTVGLSRTRPLPLSSPQGCGVPFLNRVLLESDWQGQAGLL